jgi:hypothetical protein
MPSINADLDAALVGCKERAAEFNDKPGWRPMSECDERDIIPFIERVEDNAYAAKREFGLFRGTEKYHADDVLRDLRDAANMALLALSILERES